MAAELRLGVSFDLGYFRQQLNKLSRIAASEFTAPIKISLHRQTVDRELNKLQQLFARRSYRINIEDASVEAAAGRISTLQKRINDLRTSVKDGIVIKVKYQEEGSLPGAPSAGAAKGGPRRPAFLDSPAYQAELKRVARANAQSLAKAAASLPSGRNRQEVERLLQVFSTQNPQGSSRTAALGAIRELIARGRYQQGLGIEGRMMPLRGQRNISAPRSAGNINRILDPIANLTENPRAMRRMLRMMPENRINTDFLGQASSRASYYEGVPGARDAQKLIRGFDPLFKSFANDFAQYAKSLNVGNPWVGKIGNGITQLIAKAVQTTRGGARGQLLLPAAGQTSASRMARAAFSGLPAITAPGIGDENAPLSRGASYMLNKARQLLGLPIGPSSPYAPNPFAGAASTPSRSYFQYGGGPQLPGSPIQLALPPAYTTGRGGYFPPGGGGGGGGGGGQGGALAFPGGGMGPSSQLPANYFQTGKFAAGVRGLGADFNQARLPLAGAVRELGDEFATATKQVLLYGTAYKALAFFTSLPGQAFEAAKALQTINNQLEAVTGSASNADRSFAFIDNLANRFNVPLASARDGFVKLYASMEPAGFSGSEIEGLFEGISKATATFGLSADQVDRVNYAFAQMASKGQIMSEELKGQLGDVLPGSLALFARAAQMSIPEFSKAMEDGAFKGEAMAQVLRNVAKIMNSDFGGAAANAANTLQGALNGMQNSVQRLYEAFEPVVNAIASQAFPIIEEAVASATEAIKAFGATIQGNDGPANMLEGNARGIYDAMQSVQEIIVAVGRIIQGLAPTFTIFGQLILTVADSISRVINTKFGGFLADLAVKVGIGMIAVQAFSRVMGFQFVASLITAAQSARTFTGSIAAMGTALRTSTVAARAFRLALTGLVVGGVLMGIEALVGVIGKLANRLRDARNSAIEAREAIKSMGASELSTEQRKISQAQQALSAAKQGSGRAMVTADQFEILKGYGLVDDLEKGSRVGKRAGKPTIEIKIDPSLVPSRELGLAEIRAQTDRALKDLYFTPAAPDLETVDLAPGKEKKAKEKKERESQVPELQERLRLAKELLDIDMQIMEARLGGNDLAVNRLEYEKELLDIASKIRMVKLEDIPDAEKALKIEALRIDEQLAFEKLIADTKKGVIEDLQKQNDALQEIEQQSSQELQNTKRYEELLRSGVNPALAKATIEVENKFAKAKQEFDLKTKQIQLEIKELEALQNRNKEQEKYLEVLKEQLKLRGFAAEGIPGAQADEQARQQQLLQPKSNAVLAIEAYDEAKQRLTDLTNPVMALTSAAQGIGDAFAQSFSSIVTGAVSVKEGLRELFQNIGKMFIDMAAKMIAQWMVMKAIGLIGAMFGAGANPPMSQGGYYDSATGLGRAGPNFGLANGGIINGSFMPVTPFAKGGMVTGPTLGLVGEGRFNEAVVPLPDGRSIPVELGQGTGNNIATNITVNVSNGQAQSTMSGRGGTSLGRELDAAVKDVILRETRPGGIIYSSR